MEKCRLFYFYFVSTLLTFTEGNTTQCGRSLSKIVASRVVGGKNAEVGAWPWQAVFVRNPHRLVSQIRSRNMFGGGSVINSKWILTAGHVLDGPFLDSLETNDWKGFLIILGMNKYPERVESLNKGTVVFEPELAVRHEKYNGSTYEYDVALLKFGNAFHEVRRRLVAYPGMSVIPFDGDVRPVCLPCYNACGMTSQGTNTFSPELCKEFENLLKLDRAEGEESAKVFSIVTGFGSVVARDPLSSNYEYPKVLQQADVEVLSDDSCNTRVKLVNDIYKSVGHTVVATYTDQMICAAGTGEQNRSDACQGDSGGPLVMKTRLSKDDVCWTQIGIVSWGLGCASSTESGSFLPGYYTNVAALMEWILDRTGLVKSTLEPSLSATLIVENDVDTRARTVTLQNCSKPKSIENGQVIEISELRTVGSVVKYSCNDGYDVSGNATVACGSNGQWENVPSCSKIQCPQLKAPDNGIAIGDGFSVGDIITFECEIGYKLEGEEESKCSSDGRWSGETRSCKEIQCNEPKKLKNGKMLKPIDLNYLSEIKYECNEGFEMEGSDVSVCNASGSWSGSPTCKAKTKLCPEPGEFSNGKIIGKLRKVGSILLFGCNPGYVLEGTHFTICNIQGNWGRFPICKAKSCDPITKLNNGKVIGKNYQIGSVIEFKCNFGFVLNGNSSAVCLEDQQWSSDPSCETLNKCIAPKAPENGGIRSTSEFYDIGRFIIYYCKTGYELVGRFWARCLITKKFSTPAPKCTKQIKVICPTPPILANGFVEDRELTKYSVGSSIKFSCKEGYLIKGKDSSTCNKRGEWGKYPTCEAITGCDKPILHGEVFIKNPRDYYFSGQYVEYECPPGYLMEGSKYSGCERSGEFYPPQPFCRIGRTSCVTGCYYEEGAPCQCHDFCIFTGDCCSDQVLFCQSSTEFR